MGSDSARVARRAFVGGLGLGAAALGAQAQAAEPGARWRPSFEPQDGWMELPGRHRFVFDATSAEGAGEAVSFADTYYLANKDGYDLKPADLAVIVILRHFATVFAYNDAIWKKYGTHFAKALKFKSFPKTLPLDRNPYNLADQKALPNDGITLDGLSGRGARYAVCGFATKKIAGMLAKQAKAKPADVEAELKANLIANAHLAAAGIVALNRAQEHGYAVAHIG